MNNEQIKNNEEFKQFARALSSAGVHIAVATAYLEDVVQQYQRDHVAKINKCDDESIQSILEYIKGHLDEYKQNWQDPTYNIAFAFESAGMFAGGIPSNTLSLEIIRWQFQRLKEMISFTNAHTFADLHDQEDKLAIWLAEAPCIIINAMEYTYLLEVTTYLTETLAIDTFELRKCLQYRGDALYYLGRYDECHAFYEEKLTQYPKSAELLYGWAVILCALDRYKAAMKLVERGLSFKNMYSKHFLHLASDICEEIEEENPYKKGLPLMLPLPLDAYNDALPNKPCPCKSGKKYKSCCKRIVDKMRDA